MAPGGCLYDETPNGCGTNATAVIMSLCNFKLTLNKVKLFTASSWMGELLCKRPVMFCLVKRLPHRKEFRRKKLQTF
jgi:hypothetical protein